MILKDKMLIRQTIQNIEDKGVNAEWALRMTLDKYRDVFSKVDDEYLRERISDVEYAGQRILQKPDGGAITRPSPGSAITPSSLPAIFLPPTRCR